MSKTRILTAALAGILGFPVVLTAGPKMGSGMARPSAPVHRPAAAPVHRPVMPNTPSHVHPSTPVLPAGYTHTPTPSYPTTPHVNVYQPHSPTVMPSGRGSAGSMRNWPPTATAHVPAPVFSSRGHGHPPIVVAALPPVIVVPSSRGIIPAVSLLVPTDPTPLVDSPSYPAPTTPTTPTTPLTQMRTPIGLRDLSDNQLLGAQGLIDAGNLTPDAQAAITDAVQGNLLTNDEIAAIQDEINNDPNLSTADRAILNGILQSDASEKRQQLTAVLQNLAQQLAGGGGLLGSLAQQLAGDGGGDPGDGFGGGGTGGDPGVAAPPAGQDAPPPVAETPDTGMQIDGLIDGGAAQKADLRKFDVIYTVNGLRTRNWDEFRAAVQSATGPTEVVFFNAETKQLESLTATPLGGLLGTEVHEVQFPTVPK